MKIKFILINFILLLSLSAPKLAAQPLKIKELKIEGNTVLAEELEKLVNSYLQQTIEERQLRKLTEQISQLYRERGYINSGAFLPRTRNKQWRDRNSSSRRRTRKY